VKKPDQKGLKFTFEFVSKFEPKVGSITLLGNVLVMEETKKVQESLSTWKKSKSVNKEIMHEVLNAILAKCNVEALVLSREVNLPPPIPLPKVEAGGKESSYIG